MRANGDQFPGHQNRICAVKWNPNDINILASGGWDDTVQIYDIRTNGPVASVYGPHICGNAIDFHDDSITMMTGSYRDDNCVEFWDVRNWKKTRNINWNGPLNEFDITDFEQDEDSLAYEQALNNFDDKKDKTNLKEEQKEDEFSPKSNKSSTAPPRPKGAFVYSCQFSKDNK